MKPREHLAGRTFGTAKAPAWKEADAVLKSLAAAGYAVVPAEPIKRILERVGLNGLVVLSPSEVDELKAMIAAAQGEA